MIYEALHGLNPIPFLTSSPTTLPLLFLHPHHSFMKRRMSILQCLHRVLSLPPGILLNVLPILRLSLATLSKTLTSAHTNSCYPLPSMLYLFTPLNILYMFYLLNIFLSLPEHRVHESRKFCFLWGLLVCFLHC